MRNLGTKTYGVKSYDTCENKQKYFFKITGNDDLHNIQVQ